MGRRAQIALPPHVRKVNARGKSYYYFEKHRGTAQARKAVRIPGEPSDPAWWDRYRELASLPAPRINPNAVGQVIDAWHTSPEWLGMSAKTQSEWLRYSDRIRAAWGDLEVSGIEPKHVLALRDAYADTPAAANNLLRCLSSLMSWSVPRGYRRDNPCREVRKLKGGDGYAPWPWPVVEAVRAEIRPDLWRVAALALYTGQRLADVLAMRRNARRGDQIRVVQNKTRKALLIPIHRDLMPMFDAVDHDAVTILANSRGAPWTEDGFKTSWNKHRPAILADRGLVFHGLRKTAVVTLLECGCTDAQVSAITGQSRQMVEHYARQVAQEKLARSAMRLWENRNENGT